VANPAYQTHSAYGQKEEELMKMMTKEIEKRIPRLGEAEEMGKDARVHVKFFSPWSGWTWYATEYDPSERRFFGYVKGDFPEYGYFSLDELSDVEMMPGVPAVERDKHWNWKTTIGQVVEAVEGGEHL
jgi:hypothetical protein